MLNDFSQTKAAIIIESLVPFIDKTCKDKNGYVIFLKNLCSAAFLFYSQDKQLDNAYKSYIIFSFTNSSYFLWNNFNSIMEDQVFNECMFPANEVIQQAVFQGLQKGNIIGNRSNKNGLDTYFEQDINNLFVRKNTEKGLKIFYSNIMSDFSHLKIPDLTNSFRNDFLNHLQLIQKKPRVVSKNEYKEFLVYFIVDLFQDYQNKAQFLPDTIMEQVYEQVEAVTFEVFKQSYENISPEAEIYQNQSSNKLFLVKDKYFYYLHR